MIHNVSENLNFKTDKNKSTVRIKYVGFIYGHITDLTQVYAALLVPSTGKLVDVSDHRVDSFTVNKMEVFLNTSYCPDQIKKFKDYLLTGVSKANAMSEEFNCVDVEAQEGAKALRTLLLGRTFSLPANSRDFLFPAVK